MMRSLIDFIAVLIVSGVFFSIDPGGDRGISPWSEALARLDQDTSSAQGSDDLESLLTRKPYRGEEKKVWVELTLVTPEYLKALVASEEGKETLKVYREIDLEKSIAFRTSLTTHTISLREYEVGERSLLIDDKGKEYKPLGWRELPSPVPMMASHHRVGILLFPKLREDKSPIIGEKTKYVEVSMRDLGKVEERAFRWAFPLSEDESK